MNAFANLIPKQNQDINTPQPAQQSDNNQNNNNNAFANLIPKPQVQQQIEQAPQLNQNIRTHQSQPGLLKSIGSFISSPPQLSDIVSKVKEVGQNIFSSLIPQEPTTPALPSTLKQPSITPDLSTTPTAQSSALMPNSIENRQTAKQLIDSFTNVGNAAQSILPQTADALKSASIDPLNLKANPKQAITDGINSIVDSINKAGQAGYIFGQTLRSGTASQKVGTVASSVSAVGGAILSPISALFSAANDIPVVGALSKAITLPFLVAGESGTKLSNTVIDNSTLPAQFKKDIKPGIGEIVSLAAQLAAGHIIEVGTQKVGALEAKYGAQDAKTIIDQAQNLAQQVTSNKTIPHRVVLPPETLQAEINRPGFSDTPAAQTLQTFVDQAKAKSAPQDAATPEQLQVFKKSQQVGIDSLTPQEKSTLMSINTGTLQALSQQSRGLGLLAKYDEASHTQDISGMQKIAQEIVDQPKGSPYDPYKEKFTQLATATTKDIGNILSSQQSQKHIEITQGDRIEPGFVTAKAPNGSDFSVKLVDAPKNGIKPTDTTPATTRQMIKLDKTNYTGMQEGSVVVRPNGTASLNLHFIKEAQGHGQGTKAVAELEKIALDKGANKVQISAFNEAKGFWEKQGYKEIPGAKTASSMLTKMEKPLDTTSVNSNYNNLVLQKKEIASSVVQIVDTKTNTVEYKTIPSEQLPIFHNAIDDTSKGIAGKEIDGKIYHLTAKTPEQMDATGAKFTGEAKINDIPGANNGPRVLTGNEVKAIRESIQSKFNDLHLTAKNEEDIGKGVDAIVKSVTDKAGNDKQVLSALRTEIQKELNTLGGGGNYKEQYRVLQIIKKEDPNMGPIVTKMEDHIANLDEKLLTSKKELTPTVKEPLTPIGQGKTKTSKLAIGVEEKAVEAKLTSSISKLPEFNRLNLKDQAVNAVKFLNENPEKAMNVALGREVAPSGITPEAIFTAVETRALENKDLVTIKQLARSQLTTEATAMGQRIRTLGERNPDSPVSVIKDVVKAREKAIETKTGLSVDKATEKIVKEIKAKVPKVDKYSWDSFIESIKC